VFIRYERAVDGKPLACFVALEDPAKMTEDVLLLGWSRCSQRDQFDRKKALRIAVSRALSGQVRMSGASVIFTGWMPLTPLATYLMAHAPVARTYFKERYARRVSRGMEKQVE